MDDGVDNSSSAAATTTATAAAAAAVPNSSIAHLVITEPADQQLVFSGTTPHLTHPSAEEDNPTPGTTGLAACITIHNKSPDRVILFRIQTTSPMSYRVRPSHGRITPETSSSVHIVLAVDSKKNDKFLVKWVAVDASSPATASSDEDFNDLFLVGGKPVETRLKCVFPADEAKGNVVTAAGPSLSHTSPVSTTSTQSHSTAASERSLDDADHPDPAEYAQASGNTEVDVLKRKLGEALALNEQLQRKLDGLQASEVTQRRVRDDPASGVDRALLYASQGNFPPVLVALLALFAFLLGLLF